MPSLRFRRLNSARPPWLAPGQALLERLPGPHLTRSSRAFSLDAHHDSLRLTQLQGGLTPAPAGPTPEGQQASISCTASSMKDASYMTPPSTFVTHQIRASPLAPEQAYAPTPSQRSRPVGDFRLPRLSPTTRVAPVFRASGDRRRLRRQARPDIKADRYADHRSRGISVVRIGEGRCPSSARPLSPRSVGRRTQLKPAASHLSAQPAVVARPHALPRVGRRSPLRRRLRREPERPPARRALG